MKEGESAAAVQYRTENAEIWEDIHALPTKTAESLLTFCAGTKVKGLAEAVGLLNALETSDAEGCVSNLLKIP